MTGGTLSRPRRLRTVAGVGALRGEEERRAPACHVPRWPCERGV